MFAAIREQLETVSRRDPAARSALEVLLCYPGVHAILLHRVAHRLYLGGWFTLARMISQFSRSVTGIEIHPGARIGRRLFIDHGMGVVIGETSEIGDDVLIYQGVTLGALSFKTDGEGNLVRGHKRHPTLEDSVVVYANATILGGDTHVGAHSIIGSNVFLMKSIPRKSVAYFKGDNLVVRPRRENELEQRDFVTDSVPEGPMGQSPWFVATSAPSPSTAPIVARSSGPRRPVIFASICRVSPAPIASGTTISWRHWERSQRSAA